MVLFFIMLSGRLDEGFRTQIESDWLEPEGTGTDGLHALRVFLLPIDALTTEPIITPPGPKMNMPKSGPNFASEPIRIAIRLGQKNPKTNSMRPNKRAVQTADAGIMANRFRCSICCSLKYASSVIVGLL